MSRLHNMKHVDEHACHVLRRLVKEHILKLKKGIQSSLESRLKASFYAGLTADGKTIFSIQTLFLLINSYQLYF